MADRESLLAINAQLMSKVTDGTATDDDLNTLKAVMGLLERSVLVVRSPSFCVRMADRETLLAINAQLMSKLTAGTATDDDLNTLKAVMHLLEQDAAKDVEKRSISSSVPQTAAKRRVRMASQLVKACHDIWGEGQEWYGRCTIERMRAEADAEDSTRVKCEVGSSAGSMVKAKADSKGNQASQDQEATKRIASANRALEARKDFEAAQRLAAAERAMASREKEHSATYQRQREEDRRREEEAVRRAEDRRRQDEARRAQEERQRKEKEEAQRRAVDRQREEDARRRLAEDRRQEQERARLAAEEKARREADEKARREAEEKAKQEAAKARREAEEKARREAEEKAKAQLDVPLLGGFAKGDAVVSRITYGIGTVLGACTVDLPDKNRRVSVDFGRYGIWDMLVSPDSEAEIYKVPTAMPLAAATAEDGTTQAPPYDTSRPNSAGARAFDDGTAASVHRVSHCDRCGAHFSDKKSLEEHKSDRLSNGTLSKCAKVQAEMPPPAAGKPSSSTFQAVVDKPEIVRTPQVERTIQALKKSRFLNGEPSAYFSTPEMFIKYNTSGDRFTVELYKGAQRETVLMNERQVAQSLTALATAGTNVESLVSAFAPYP